MSKHPNETLDNETIIKRRDEAVRHALNSPPKPLREVRKGKKKRQDKRPTSSSEKRD